MQEEEKADCCALLAEQRALANEYHTSIWRSVHFFSALITALLGLSVVLIGYQAPRILVITFPLLALLFSIFGMIVLYRRPTPSPLSGTGSTFTRN
jgi:hypothetical protein